MSYKIVIEFTYNAKIRFQATHSNGQKAISPGNEKSKNQRNRGQVELAASEPSTEVEMGTIDTLKSQSRYIVSQTRRTVVSTPQRQSGIKVDVWANRKVSPPRKMEFLMEFDSTMPDSRN